MQSITDFGAKAGDPDSVVRAIRAGVIRNNVAYVPPGVWDTGYIELPNGAMLIGAGHESRLRLKVDSLGRHGECSVIKPLAFRNNFRPENIRVHNVTIDGNRRAIDFAALGAIGDGVGHGIATWGCRNIDIQNVRCVDCYTDGVYVSASHSTDPVFVNSSGVIHDIEVTDCRRQGVSVISGENLSVRSLTVNRVTGISPKAAIDCEPNGARDVIRDVNVQGVRGYGNGAGVLVSSHANASAGVIGPISVSNVRLSDLTGNHAVLVSSANVTMRDIEIYGYSGNTPCVEIRDKARVDIDRLLIDSVVGGQAVSALSCNDAVCSIGRYDARQVERVVLRTENRGEVAMSAGNWESTGLTHYRPLSIAGIAKIERLFSVGAPRQGTRFSEVPGQLTISRSHIDVSQSMFVAPDEQRNVTMTHMVFDDKAVDGQ